MGQRLLSRARWPCHQGSSGPHVLRNMPIPPTVAAWAMGHLQQSLSLGGSRGVESDRRRPFSNQQSSVAKTESVLGNGKTLPAPRKHATHEPKAQRFHGGPHAMPFDGQCLVDKGLIASLLNPESCMARSGASPRFVKEGARKGQDS